ncbi:MAG TPA: hypothetical protein VGH77_22325, partial [Streptosporangiaceae bacterium]
MPRKASTRWRGERSIAASYFFRRTGRSQKGPGGLLSARPLPLLSGGSAPGWLPPLLLLPGPPGRLRVGGPALRPGPRAGLGLRARLPADPASAPRAGLGVRCGGPPRDGAPNQGGAELGGWAGGAVGGGAAPPGDRAGPLDDRAGPPDDRAGLLDGGGAAAGGRGATPGQRCRDVDGADPAGGRAGVLLAGSPAAAGELGWDVAAPLARDRPLPVSPAPDRDQPDAGRGQVPSRYGRSSGG